MGLILGLDGGGSKTLLAVANQDAEILLVERSDGMDPAANPDWAPRLQSLMEKAHAAGDTFAASVFGLSSHGEIEAQSLYQRYVVETVAGPGALVENDVRVAFDGALAGRGGVLLLAGTGSMAWASRGGPDAPQIRIGGWGEAFGDEGSAFWIGREALSEATRALDGRGAAHAFAAALLAALGIEPRDLFTWVYGSRNRRRDFAALARIVSALCDAGDPDARILLERAAAHLAAHARAARHLVGSAEPLAWSYAGGVFASPVFLDGVRRDLGADPVPPRLPPVGGALLRAAERAGWPVDDAWIDRLAAALATRPFVLPPQP